MGELAPWGPTIVTVLTCIFFAGVLWNGQNNHTKRLDDHDDQLDDHTKDITQNALDIRELKAWKEGYAAARAVYQPQHPAGD